MGLLDDAIREHLELKRRNGADPGEVAREQQEALDPVFPDPSAASDRDAELPAEQLAEGDGEFAADTPEPAPAPSVAEAHPDAAWDSPPPPDTPSTGQETVELDMQSVLHAGGEDPVPASTVDPALDGTERDVAPHEADGESLEWEMPGDSSDAPDEHLADARRGSLYAEWDRAEDPGGSEDVPRELPGQERLSFE